MTQLFSRERRRLVLQILCAREQGTFYALEEGVQNCGVVVSEKLDDITLAGAWYGIFLSMAVLKATSL